jgi:hypothetical protein
MWDDAKQMNAIAVTLAVLVAAAMAWGGVAWAVRQPAFALREVVVVKPLERASAAHLEAVVREELAGTFFTMDLTRAQRALAQVPWVRNVATAPAMASSPRNRSGRTRAVRALERRRLVNSRGEVFKRRMEGRPAQFQGQDGRAAEMTAQYNAWTGRLAPLSLAVRSAAPFRARKLAHRRDWSAGTACDRARSRRRGCAAGALCRGAAANAGRARQGRHARGVRRSAVPEWIRGARAQFREKAVKPAA